MLKKYFNSIAAFLLVTFITSSSFASFTIMPTKIDINKDNKIATMTLQNNDYMPKSFQLVLYKREYKDGKEEYIETKDLIATPVMFTLQGNKTQLIRIALKNKENYSTGENDYRIAVKELPHRMQVNNINSVVNFIVEFNVPITISG